MLTLSGASDRRMLRVRCIRCSLDAERSSTLGAISCRPGPTLFAVRQREARSNVRRTRRSNSVRTAALTSCKLPLECISPEPLESSQGDRSFAGRLQRHRLPPSEQKFSRVERVVVALSNDHEEQHSQKRSKVCLHTKRASKRRQARHSRVRVCVRTCVWWTEVIYFTLSLACLLAKWLVTRSVTIPLTQCSRCALPPLACTSWPRDPTKRLPSRSVRHARHGDRHDRRGGMRRRNVKPLVRLDPSACVATDSENLECSVPARGPATHELELPVGGYALDAVNARATAQARSRSRSR